MVKFSKAEEKKIKEVEKKLDRPVRKPYGFNFYDLQAPVQTLYPVAPSKNFIARPKSKKSIIYSHWKVQTNGICKK